jgi:cytochrome c biogenesis protein CcmG, thiol:disulfide interchange protein DsbE
MWEKRGWVLFVVAGLLLLGLSLVIIRVRESKAAPTVRPQVGYLAPDFTLPSLDGKMVRLSDFRGKKGVFINFWATWCPPCRLEMPTMEQAYQEYQSRGLEILAVSIDVGPKSVVRDFMQEFRLTFPALLDPEGEVMHLYRLFSIPASFLIDKHGIIRFKELGYRDWTNPKSRKKLEAILK